MRAEDWHRERSCTRKRPFATRFYAEKFLDNVLKNERMEAYHCTFCRQWHLGHPNPLRLPSIENGD